MKNGPDVSDRGVRVREDTLIASVMERSLAREFLAYLDKVVVGAKFKGKDLSDFSFDGYRFQGEFRELRDRFAESLEGIVGMRVASDDDDALDALYDWEPLDELMREIERVFMEHVEDLDEGKLDEALEEASDDEEQLAIINNWFKKQIRALETKCPSLVKERENQEAGLAERLKRLPQGQSELVSIDGAPRLKNTGLTRLGWDFSDKYMRYRESDAENGILVVRIPVREAQGEECDKPDAKAVSIKGGSKKEIPVMFIGYENKETCTHILIHRVEGKRPGNVDGNDGLVGDRLVLFG